MFLNKIYNEKNYFPYLLVFSFLDIWLCPGGKEELDNEQEKRI
jgi:hypothetical protein